MKLTFQINRDYLIAHTIWCWEQEHFSSPEHRQDLLAFINAVWDKYQSTYQLLANRLMPDSFVTAQQPFQVFRGALVEAEQAMSEIEAMSEYKKIYDQTNDYMELCKAQWQENLSVSEKAIRELTGFDLDKTSTVIITHPSLRNGHNFGIIDGQPTFTWGTTQAWPNYITVYLWHEILHGYFDKSETSHALIQFIADNELRVKLNGGEYPPFEGHTHLYSLMERLLPEWRHHLNSPNRNLNDFIRSLR